MELKPIEDTDILKIKGFREMAESLEKAGGYTAKHFGIAFKILKEMLEDRECFIFLSFPASLVATGFRGILKTMLERNLVNAVITTCGTLDHDLARVWKDYYHGYFSANDKELHRKGINREGNIFIPNECYGEILEEKMQPILKEIYEEGKRDLAPFELVWEFGKRLEKEERGKSSITYWAYKNKIPIFLPGPLDGAFGYQIWLFWQDGHRDFNINVLKDEEKISELVYKAERTGAIMLGGGISKHHTIWWNQFREGLDYAIYITTAPEWDGSLSGARLREAVSWGKIKEGGKFITIPGEVTVIFPFLIKAVLEDFPV